MTHKETALSVCEVIASISMNAGGTGTYMADISKYLPDTVSNVSLLSAAIPGDNMLSIDERVRLRLVSTMSVGISGRLGLLSRPESRSALEEMDNQKGIDIVHVHGIWLDICRTAIRWARDGCKPLVVSPHGMLEPWALNHKKLKKRVAWFIYQQRELLQANAFHACSMQEAENIRRLGFKQPIAVIANGVELPKINPASSIENDLLQPKRTALFLSRINPKKGLPMLLDVWKALAPDGWRLVIAGNDDSNHLPVVQAKIREHNLQDEVELAGPLFGAAKDAAFRNADLFLLPSYSENFGIVVAEALGYQVPVLTTTGCPWKELETDRCGWWVEPTPAGIEQGLQLALASSGQELSEMGARGRALVEEKYQWPGIAERMVEFYDWILNGGKQPGFVI